ncbi:MAG: alpha-2-macroglobulin family protein, partial [Thiotrichaceae bacterium]
MYYRRWKVINSSQRPFWQGGTRVKSAKLNEFGALDGEFTLPKNAAVGWYEFELTNTFQHKQSGAWRPMRVLVSDFTPAPFRVNATLEGKVFRLGDTVNFATTATLHAGGPYANAKTRMHAVVEQAALMPNAPQAKDFTFDTETEESYDNVVHDKDDYRVDDKGELHANFTLPEKLPVLYGDLRVESAVQDERGKNVATTVVGKYVGRDRFVGLKETSWLLESGKEAKVEAIVIDEFGEPLTVTNAEGNLVELQFKIEREEIKASRVKGAGNAYLTQYNREWVDAGQCREAVDGKFFAKTFPATCSFVPEKAGDYRITATVTDTKGRTQSTQLSQWATGKDWVTWESEPGHSLQVIPEQESYKVGETARYLVKNPFPGAQALITVERLGVIKSWVKPLATSMEVIEIPVEADFVPGFFVSVVVMSPRVDKPIDDNQVDLGKPAFRMGYTKTQVADPYKQLIVDIHTDKPEYRPREQVTIDLQAKPLHAPLPTVQQEGKEVPQPIELAVAVLDEGVFDLIHGGKDYFDPYKGFYTLDELDVSNFSLLLNLVGRQKFEKKGATPGGDGGMGVGMRSVFKYVSYWNPSIKADTEGKARIQFNAPDNLTGWRVLVMAITPTDRMGLSDANFKVNQPLEIRPVMPNQVLEGDSFYAGFSIMNRTDKPHQVSLSAQAKGNFEAIPCPAELKYCGAQQTLQAEPYKRYIVWLPIKAKTAGKIEFSVQAKSGELQDGLTQSLEIRPR